MRIEGLNLTRSSGTVTILATDKQRIARVKNAPQEPRP
jgi:hypothetical protein